jgi:ribosomal protein S18 acetylase RimI-like enzyme
MTVDLLIRRFTEADRAAVIDLWRRTDLVRPWNDPDRDLDRKLALDDGLLLVAELTAAPDGRGDRTADVGGAPDQGVAGSVMVGYDGHRGWLNYLAVDPALQGAGIGRQLVADAEQRLLALGCPKVNLMVRSTNAAVVAFYRSLGYAIDDVTALGKRLISDG